MLEFIQYATSGFWVFLGTVVILALVLKIVAVTILGLAAIFSKRDGKINIG
jgi:hypothetical protein